MRRNQAAAWVISVCAGSLRLSQIKTLSVLVSAALCVQRVSLANIGRQMLGTAKHQIKRCWTSANSVEPRFCANERIETADAMRPIVAQMLKKRKKKLLIAVDWVDIKSFQTLMASVVLKGRSTPIAWASTTNHVYDGHRSRNAFEESLLLVLRDMIPQRIKVVILADRGFGRTALASFCQKIGFGYIIRIQPGVTVRLHGFFGKLLDYPVYKGIAKVLRRVSYRSDGAVTQSVVVHWRRGLPKKRDECWFLMTDQPSTAVQLCRLYGQRMTIEQLFRDDKSKRNGWSLRDTRITKPDRLDRLLLILAVAYLLLCGIGLVAKTLFTPSAWCSTNRDNECSIYTIGMIMARKINASPPEAFAAVIHLSESALQNWG
jgi:Transposase DDE domain